MHMDLEQSRKKTKTLRIVLGGCFLTALVCVGSLVVALAAGFIRFSGLQPIIIEEVILTTEIDAQGMPVNQATHFAPTVEKIGCLVRVSAPKPIRVGVRWYYQDTLISDIPQVVDRANLWWLSRTSGDSFPEGQYRVEVYLINDLIRTVHFTVGQ